MIILNKDQQRRPIGGHHFPEEGRTFSGETLEEVVKRIREWRISNGRPVGDPEADVIRFYSENFPYMVIEDENVDPKPGPSEDYVRYRHWIQATWKNPPKKLVPNREAKERQAVCDNCPKKKIVDWGSSEEARELERRSFVLRCGIHTSVTTGYCTCHRWDIGTIVTFHGPEQFSAKEKDTIVPESCWAVTNLAGNG